MDLHNPPQQPAQAQLQSTQKQPAPDVESWDDDLDIHGHIFSNSLSTVKTSLSSRLSIRSESNTGEDDNLQLPLTTNDDTSTSKAIESAKQAGIPIPIDVPASALVGGSIKRLGKRNSRQKMADDWSEDLDLSAATPGHGLKLKLAPQPATLEEEDGFDDWAEGSLGIRFGGTKKDGKPRSSSVSALSPSLGSCMTLESDDDGLNGLVLPTGPVDFQSALQKRQETADVKSPEPPKTAVHDRDQHTPFAAATVPKAPPERSDDFFDDIDFGAGDVFDPKKRAANRNIKQNWKPPNTSSPVSARTQTTLTFTDKDKSSTKIPRPVSVSRAARLEPVFETGATNVTRPRYAAATMSSAQLLRTKRSMPVLGRNDSPSLGSRPPLPSVPSQARSPFKGIPVKPVFHSRRESDPHRPGSPLRPASRLSANLAPDTPTRNRRDVAPASLTREAAAKRTVTRPARRRNFGDGTELDLFDDLPTSAAKEQKFMKPASSKPPASKTLRTQMSQSRLGLRDKMTTPLPPATPKSPTKPDQLPRFARDTAASRIAREQKLGPAPPILTSAPKPREGPLAPRINWHAQVAARSPATSPSAQRTLRKGPTLINPMGKENARHFQDDAARKGMRWNSVLLRWEGNDTALAHFDPPPPPSPPRPALITNLAGSQGVQVVGGMVFDPQRMCWLKMGASKALSVPTSPSVEEEEDPFKDIPDLKDETPTPAGGLTSATGGATGGEWLVGEEFDLGPAFIARQREEEALWRSKTNGWFEGRAEEGEVWKYAICDIASTAQI